MYVGIVYLPRSFTTFQLVLKVVDRVSALSFWKITNECFIVAVGRALINYNGFIVRAKLVDDVFDLLPELKFLERGNAFLVKANSVKKRTKG